MGNILSPTEEMQFSVTKLYCFLENGGISEGTGFFFKALEQSDGINFPVIVTNKHVVENAQSAEFRIQISGEDGMPILGKFADGRIDNFQ